MSSGLLLAGVAGLAAPGDAPRPPARVDAAYFTRVVQPVLERRCLGCHGVGARLSRLDLRTREGALRGGARGPALVPGSAARSPLYLLAAGRRTPQMPPQERLPTAEVEVLRAWIDGGAPWSGGAVETAAKQRWWSFQPPRAPAVPTVARVPLVWRGNPVDAFVLARLRAAGLAPSPPAEPRVLVRRLYFDLVGLPPAPEEVEAFSRECREEQRAHRSMARSRAWERLVDRLLSSPQYGERWGRHWLDLVRYAESSGFEGDKDRPHAWRYRDYVIRSFSQDKPYDLFLQEQLAGDELRPGDTEALVATGYLACGQEDFAMKKLPMTRADEVDDLVSTTGAALLGLTVGCARCHDHKYDPVSMQDYYRLAALFAPTERREVEIPTPEERREIEAQHAAVERELAPKRARAAALREQGRIAAIGAGVAKPDEGMILSSLTETERKELLELQAAVKAGEAAKRPMPQALTVTDKGREFPPTHLLLRGDANRPGPEVAPGFLTALPGGDAAVAPPPAAAATTGRRRALAEWLTRPEHPLTARVWVNRVWRQHFGRGLVNTPSNFGLNGELPSHPELLDYLAVGFAAGEYRLAPRAAPWSVKALHRLLVTSAAYRQSSAVRPEAAVRDPQNRLLWRMPVRRLEAEAIRDSVLAVAGTLKPEMGGPPVYPPVDPSLRADTFQGPNWPVAQDTPDTWRRSVYVKVKRSLPLPQLEVFDCPEITASVPARNVTTTPSQALTMLNDPLIVRQAGFFAARLAREAGPDPARQVERGFRLALGRAPTVAERERSLRFLRESPKEGAARFCHALLNLSEFVYVE